MEVISPLWLVLLASLWSTYATHVPESSSHKGELLVRGGLPSRATKNNEQENWLELLSTFVPRKNSSIPQFHVASFHVGKSALPKVRDVISVAKSPVVLNKGVAQLSYSSGMVVMCLLVCWMYYRRGLLVVFTILCYIISLSSMTLTMRNVYVNFDFHYPRFLSACHFLFTALIGLCIQIHQKYAEGHPITIPSFSQFMKGIFPVSIVFALSIGTANLGLLHTNAHFYEMVEATTTLATAGFWVMMGKPFDSMLLLPLLLVTFGLMFCAFGELVFSALGFGFCAAAVVLRAMKGIIQHQLMAGDIDKRLDPIQLVVWMSFPSFVIMALWSGYSEGIQPWYAIQSSGTLGAISITVIGACILNTAALYVLRSLGPVGQKLAGQLKGVLSILGSVAFFEEIVTIQQIVGYIIIIGGVYWYNRRDMWIADQINASANDTSQKVSVKAQGTSPEEN